jgi:hypothetical protein
VGFFMLMKMKIYIAVASVMGVPHSINRWFILQETRLEFYLFTSLHSVESGGITHVCEPTQNNGLFFNAFHHLAVGSHHCFLCLQGRILHSANPENQNLVDGYCLSCHCHFL